MNPRRKQQVVSVRSDFLAERLKLLTRDGRSQAAILEEAVAKLPTPDGSDEMAERRARIAALIKKLQALPGRKITMSEFDASEYDEFGLPR